nr:1-acyl-sn-glycerol-3-phosphate acyltransferase [Caulobacter sp. B11]
MIYLRSFLFQLWFWLWSIATVTWMIPFFALPRRATMWALRIWANGIILGLRWLAGVRIEVRGRENLPTGPALVAPKHQSMFDVFSQFALLPDASFVMKKELLNVPLFGWYGLKGGMIVVDRSGAAMALKKLVRDTLARMKEVRQVVIFPEGTRGKPAAHPRLRPAALQPGIAALYRELNLPVTPMALNTGMHWGKGSWSSPASSSLNICRRSPPV